MDDVDRKKSPVKQIFMFYELRVAFDSAAVTVKYVIVTDHAPFDHLAHIYSSQIQMPII